MKSVAIFLLFGPLGLWLHHRRDGARISTILSWAGLAVCSWIGGYILLILLSLAFFVFTQLITSLP